LTTKERKQEAEEQKKKKNGKEIKLKFYEIQDTHTDPLKEVLKYLNGRYVPRVGLLLD
jgi:hypothetical protein